MSGVLRYVELDVVAVAPPGQVSRLELRVHPNPFRAGMTVTFELPRASPVSLRVLDLEGREVARLLSGELPAGRHQHSWDGRGVPSGAYFCELRAGRDLGIQKALMLR